MKEKVLDNKKNGMGMMVLFILFEGCAEYYSGCGHGIEQNKQHHHSHTIFL